MASMSMLAKGNASSHTGFSVRGFTSVLRTGPLSAFVEALIPSSSTVHPNPDILHPKLDIIYPRPDTLYPWLHLCLAHGTAERFRRGTPLLHRFLFEARNRVGIPERQRC